MQPAEINVTDARHRSEMTKGYVVAALGVATVIATLTVAHLAKGEFVQTGLLILGGSVSLYLLRLCREYLAKGRQASTGEIQDGRKAKRRTMLSVVYLVAVFVLVEVALRFGFL